MDENFCFEGAQTKASTTYITFDAVSDIARLMLENKIPCTMTICHLSFYCFIQKGKKLFFQPSSTFLKDLDIFLGLPWIKKLSF